MLRKMAVWCVDVLRGIALLAILIANVSDFGLPIWDYLVPLSTSKPASLVRTLTDHGNEVNHSPGRLVLRYQRRCYHGAVDTQLGQLPVQYESCWPRFVAGAQLLRRTILMNLRIESSRLAIVPRLRTSPSASAMATAIVSAWTSMPRNRNFSLMTGSSACGSGLEFVKQISLTTASAAGRSLHND